MTGADNIGVGQYFYVSTIQCDANLIWVDVITSNSTDRAFMIQVDFAPRPAASG